LIYHQIQIFLSSVSRWLNLSYATASELPALDSSSHLETGIEAEFSNQSRLDIDMSLNTTF